MHLKQPVDAPPAQVFAALDDVEGLVGGLSSDRASLKQVAPGQWDVVLQIQDKARTGTLQLADRGPGAPYCLTGFVDGLELTGVVAVLGDGGNAASEIDITLALAARTMRAKLVLAGLTVTQGHLRTRLESRLATFAQMIEARGA